MTGLSVAEFDTLYTEMQGYYMQAEWERLERPYRKRDIGAGHPFSLNARDQILLTVVWLRVYPTYEVLGYLFGVSDTTTGRIVQRVLPMLEKMGRDGMRLPHPGRKRRRQLDDLLRDIPELAVIIDSFEQAVQRPTEHTAADALFSGKKKRHTLKSQVAVNEDTGCIVDISESVAGPTADMTLLRRSSLMKRLPPGVRAIGDLGYVGIESEGCGSAPKRKPRGKPRPPDDIAYNTAFSKRRIIVEHSIGRMRRYQALFQTDRHHRQQHSARVCAVAGLVNRQLTARFVA
jgi:hypothetical protein